MKILIFNNYYYPWNLGGAERSVETLAQGIKSRGHEVVIVSLAGNACDSFIDTVNDIKVYYIKDTNFGSSPTTSIRTPIGRIAWQISGEINHSYTKFFINILNQETPDVVHTNNLGGVSIGIWRAAHLMSIPIVHTLRGYYLLCAKGTMLSHGKTCDKRCFKCRLLTQRRKFFSNKINTVVGNSNFILNTHLRSKYFDQATQKLVIYSAFNRTPAFSRRSADSHVVFGFIGRLHPSKGLSQLLDTLTQLDSSRYSVLIAGDGDSKYVETLKHSVIDKKHISFSGWISPEEFFPNIDVLIVPSLWHDPLPRVVYESYNYGKPVIGSNRGGIPESIDEGQTGWIYDPDNPKQLLSILDRILENPESLGSMNSLCVDKAHDFSLEKCVTQYIEAYEGAFDGK
ncbi:glycosyltransferase family 4 protein [Ketobacter alkanivorans]|uniref:Glycosyltransferase subfamily 4-like N-terminal domain-containing protein n=1 Tax=Ketobacter alkanivorans TaxID=1917421 RepID=A0A2K9LND1_9GAMM|nr:glycosyltransferase family 4 protein [Ketobacter alkanivorans]AUM13747.1 hypothetical protein Kalk_15525 [Ketobacter alkanivorans]